jgi:hypothetical protein
MAERPSPRSVEWAIGVYVGEAPFTVEPAGVDAPVLTSTSVSDIPADFVADPFMLQADTTWYMFFEAMHRKKARGEIGLATSNNGTEWNYEQIVLAEPYHLSYPYVFEWSNEYFMIPESYQAGSIQLYRASEFPTEWSFAANLLSGAYYVDSSILRYDDKWWLFTDASLQARHDTLRLFWADDLTEGWVEHPQSPIISANPQIARPAGRMILFNGRPIRFTQSCYPVYGTQVRAFEILELTTRRYEEREIGPNPIIGATGFGWNREGMHHIDAHPIAGRWVACVDGFTSGEDSYH